MTQTDARGVRAQAKTVLTDASGERFFGPGVVALLKLIDETGSVKAACARMGLSYTKGWRLVHTLEDAAGFACVTRQQGGIGGGKASVTAECQALIVRFENFTRDVDALVADCFARHFGSGPGLAL